MNISLCNLQRLCLWVFLLGAALAASSAARAADIILLAGHQSDADLRISTPEQWPPDNLPAGAPGDGVDVANGNAWAVAVNRDFNNNPNQKTGLFYSRQQTELGTSAGLADPSLEIAFLHFTGTTIYPQGDRLAFFVLAGVGAAFYKPADPTLKDVTRFSAQLGGGANFRLSDNLLLQLDARWLPAFFNGQTAVFCSGGCAISVNADSYNQVQLNAGVLFRF